MSPDHLLEQLQAAVRAARAAGADDVEVSHTSRDLGMARFANSGLTQSGVVAERQTRVRVALGGRLGAATTDALDADALAEAGRLALEAARHQPKSTAFAGFARPDPARPLAAGTPLHPATVALGPEERADILAGIFAAAAKENLVCAGSFTSGGRRHAVVTDGGVAVSHETSQAFLSIIALDGPASGYAAFCSPDVGRLDARALADEAIGKAARSRGAGELAPGVYDVVLCPAAVVELLEWMAGFSFSARYLLDGTSLLAGREGEPVCGAEVTLVDDSTFAHPDALAFPFDAEGTGKQPVTCIDRGRAGRPVSDLHTAAQLGGASTGHAMPVGIEYLEGPSPANLVFLPGDASLDDLIGRVDDGLYVTRFHYVNGLLDTRRATMTGMTRDGTFRIQGGKLGAPVKNLRFTESILAAFARLGGVGKDLTAVQTTWSTLGAYLAPALLVRGFHFTRT